MESHRDLSDGTAEENSQLDSLNPWEVPVEASLYVEFHFHVTPSGFLFKLSPGSTLLSCVLEYYDDVLKQFVPIEVDVRFNFPFINDYQVNLSLYFVLLNSLLIIRSL